MAARSGDRTGVERPGRSRNDRRSRDAGHWLDHAVGTTGPLERCNPIGHTRREFG
jgi:hypothetical protein